LATTVKAATLTVVVTETVTLNGVAYNASNTRTIASVTEVSQRIVSVPTSEIVILAFAATNPAAGSFDEADVRYVRITNLDDTNFVQLIFRSEGSAEYAIKLDKGQTYILGVDDSGGVVDVMDASASALTVAFEDLVDITALADTAECDLELYVAGV
jgi:hypothetical protein